MVSSSPTAALALAALLAAAGGALVAQEHPPTEPAPPRPHLESAAEHKRGARTAPTHAPQPALPPMVAWLHVEQGNRSARQAIAARQPLPEPADRPAGAGRYVCAVLVCADADLDLGPLLGLQRRSVLVIAVPGPFADPASLALLERTFAAERFPLLLVLGHAHCRTLAPNPAGGAPDAIEQRLERARAEAKHRQWSLTRSLLLLQREQLLAASDPLRAAVARDQLRVLPAELDDRTGALTWHHQPIDALPLAPVK